MTEVGREPEVVYQLSHRIEPQPCAECGDDADYYLYDRPEEMSEYRCETHSQVSLPSR